MSDTLSETTGMSDRLALSAAFSVLLMTLYVLLGGDAAHAPLGLVQQDQIAARDLPSLRVIMVEAGSRRILY